MVSLLILSLPRLYLQLSFPSVHSSLQVCVGDHQNQTGADRSLVETIRVYLLPFKVHGLLQLL